MTRWLSRLAVAVYALRGSALHIVRGMVEATTGFEPVNRGFADPSPGHSTVTFRSHGPLVTTLRDDSLAVALAVA